MNFIENSKNSESRKSSKNFENTENSESIEQSQSIKKFRKYRKTPKYQKIRKYRKFSKNLLNNFFRALEEDYEKIIKSSDQRLKQIKQIKRLRPITSESNHQIIKSSKKSHHYEYKSKTNKISPRKHCTSKHYSCNRSHHWLTSTKQSSANSANSHYA